MADGRALSHETLEEMRLKAIAARIAGQSVVEIARSFGLNRCSVSRWITTYNRKGKAALLSRKSPGARLKLDCKKYKDDILKIVKTEATAFNFENPLWNCTRIKAVLRSELGINVSTATVWRGLKKLKLSSQKPERRAVEQNPEKRTKWLRYTWPRIKKLAKKKRAIIFFQDEACIRLTPTVGKSWGEIGKRPKVTLTGKRASLCVMSAVSKSGKLFFSIPDKNVDSSVFINFLENLLKEYPNRKLFVIVDGASPHKSHDTFAFIFNHSRIQLFFLPPYSPDFNPDEKTWNHLKNHELKAHQAFDKESLKELTRKKLHKMSKNAPLIRSFFYRANVS